MRLCTAQSAAIAPTFTIDVSNPSGFAYKRDRLDIRTGNDIFLVHVSAVLLLLCALLVKTRISDIPYLLATFSMCVCADFAYVCVKNANRSIKEA